MAAMTPGDRTGTVIVTGATGGIGKALIQRLAADGHRLHLMGRSIQALSELAADISATFSSVDLSDEQAIRKFSRDWTEPVYALIHNAAVVHVSAVDGPETLDEWTDTLSVNLIAPYLLTNGLQDRIVDGGRIVNISSQLGRVGRAGYGAYCASKFALIGATKCWAHELGARQITVNAVLPSWVSTAQALGDAQRQSEEQGIDLDEHLAGVVSQLELRRMTRPEEVAALVSYLLSDDAAGVSGQEWLLTAATG
ncbi:SDR family oxidoreductase [Streptomyces sp. NPDC088270]|uniref:SDR family NAD(P)-dependent oxidoreductase n=1 Tax=Streptomyces sp. NPDC088270 TaxID=3160990 RepID=UPI00344A1EE5